MENYQSLEAHLSSPKLNAYKFFQIKGISQQIIRNIEIFVKYCRTHPTFTKSFVTLALNMPYSQLEDIATKSASCAAIEVLCCEETSIAELFFEENIESIPDESPLFNSQKADEKEGELQPYQLIILSLQILNKPESNETSLGYLHKLFSFLIRHNPNPVLRFFTENPKKLQLLLNNLSYPSVGLLVAQMLATEDRSKIYKYQNLKKKIVQYLIEDLFEKAQDQDAFYGLMILVQEILNATKQSDYQFFEDFKRVASLLVSQAVTYRMLDLLLERNEPLFHSASSFLELLFSRINQEVDDSNMYGKEELTQLSMDFHVDVFLDNLPALTDLVVRIEDFHNLTKISYISFLQGLFRYAKFKKYRFILCQPAFIELLDSLNQQSKSGVLKSKLYSLISIVIDISKPQGLTRFMQEYHQMWQKYFTSIRQADNQNLIVYNKNDSAAFDIGLIYQLAKKVPDVYDIASQAIGKNFRKICKRYERKIEKPDHNSVPTFPDQSQYQFKLLCSALQNLKQKSTLSLDSINKNIETAYPNPSIVEESHAHISKEQDKQADTQNFIQVTQKIQEPIIVTDPTTTNDTSRPPIINEATTSKDNKLSALLPNSVKHTLLNIQSKLNISMDQVRYFTKHLSIFG